MPSLVYVCSGIAGLFLVIVLAWRLISHRYSLPCPTWLGWLVELDNPFAEGNRASRIVQRLALEPGMTVLDLGCGPGRVTIPVAQQVGPGGRVVAVDIQPGMLQRAREKAKSAHLENIAFVQAGAGEGTLRVEHDRFDRALLVTVLGEIPNRQAALKEIFDALRPGGILSITEIMFDPHFQSRGAVQRSAGAVGFREKEFFGGRFAFTMNLEKPA